MCTELFVAGLGEDSGSIMAEVVASAGSRQVCSGEGEVDAARRSRSSIRLLSFLPVEGISQMSRERGGGLDLR